MKTVEDLKKLEQFTFGDWVKAHGGDVEKAVVALEVMLTDAHDLPYLEQPDVADDDAVWDGGFVYRDSQVYYVGADGTGGGGKTVECSVGLKDQITLY